MAKKTTKSKKSSKPIKTKFNLHHKHSCSCISMYGSFLLAIGIIWFLDEIHILTINFSLWPLVFMITGLTIIFHKIKKIC
jgi:hypothetical protein